MGCFRVQRLIYLLSPCDSCSHLRRRQILSAKIFIDFDQFSMEVIDVPDDRGDLLLVEQDESFIAVTAREDLEELAVAGIG